MISILVVLLISVSLHSCAGDMWTTKWFPNMPVDHFSYANSSTFSMRYLVNDTFFEPGMPILFYAGNEGDITLFAQNTGLMFDIAPEFKALIIFAEHRYYGKTMPFGNNSFSNTQARGYLSSEQALADYAVFLRSIKGEIEWEGFDGAIKGTDGSPVVVFGGSYGGMLAAWMRMKYPNIVVGALAASAPIWQFHGLTPCYKFTEIVTRTFHNSGPNCDDVVRKSWQAIRNVAKNDTDGITWLNQAFGFCPNSTINTYADVQGVLDWLNDIWGNMAMVDYPYPSSFLAPVPGFPVKVACTHMNDSSVDDKEIITQIIAGLSVFQNYTGAFSCFDTGVQGTASLGDAGWNYQSCTEMVMPMCNNGTDMFDPTPWDFKTVSDNCFKQFGVRPRRDWAMTNYGGHNISGASNIIFSNGHLDPWSGGGVTFKPPGTSDSIVLIYIEDGAHHLDIRAADPQDPPDLIAARNLEVDIIRCWVNNPAGTMCSAPAGNTTAASPTVATTDSGASSTSMVLSLFVVLALATFVLGAIF